MTSTAARPPALTRKLGFPPAAALFPIPLGAFACSLLFDIAARLDSGDCSPFIYPAFALQVVGVGSGLVVVTLALPDLVRLRPNPSAYRSGVRQLLLCDAALVCFGVSMWARHDRNQCLDVPLWVFLLSIAGAALLAVSTILALRVVFSLHPPPESHEP